MWNGVVAVVLDEQTPVMDVVVGVVGDVRVVGVVGMDVVVMGK